MDIDGPEPSEPQHVHLKHAPDAIAVEHADQIVNAVYLDTVEPDHVHVLQGGRIVESGDKDLALELERRGYGLFGDAA